MDPRPHAIQPHWHISHWCTPALSILSTRLRQHRHHTTPNTFVKIEEETTSSFWAGCCIRIYAIRPLWNPAAPSRAVPCCQRRSKKLCSHRKPGLVCMAVWARLSHTNAHKTFRPNSVAFPTAIHFLSLASFLSFVVPFNLEQSTPLLPAFLHTYFYHDHHRLPQQPRPLRRLPQPQQPSTPFAPFAPCAPPHLPISSPDTIP